MHVCLKVESLSCYLRGHGVRIHFLERQLALDKIPLADRYQLGEGEGFANIATARQQVLADDGETFP